VIPEDLNYETYEDYKADMREYYGSVKANRDELVEFVRLVQAFDRLCDELRDYVNDLSKLSYELEEMRKIVEEFNDTYADDLELLGFKELEVNEAGEVAITEIYTLQCLAEAFQRLADRKNIGYRLAYDGGTKVKLEQI
jgi:chromosome condensin MukBEF ATPase and DNA-binding subunit MukB